MALSLSAEQKNLKSLFINDDKYVIPAYQRPYSWTDEQLMQLYYDVTAAFVADEEYFLGNIILAKSRSDKGVLEIIDGQQRMITLWIAVKTLSVLMPSVTRLRSMIELASWDDDCMHPKIEWESDECNENGQLTDLLNWEAVDFEEKGCPSGRLYDNARKLYHWFKDFLARLDQEEVKRFRKFFIESVYLLPIELSGETSEDAQAKALTIFETINNRGLDLQDADIFKARMYNMARHSGQSEMMRGRWGDLVMSARNLDMTVDDVFRFYSHIIRGRQSITTNEKRLRDFYTLEPYSPLKTMSVTEVFDELYRIVDVLYRIDALKNSPTRIGAWLQVLDAYTNRYPWYALVAYIYKNLETISEDGSELEPFLHKMIRFCYISGSTSSIKFNIYAIISSIMHGYAIEDYRGLFLPDWLTLYPGRLKAGLTMLAFYLENPKQGAIRNLNTDRILKSCDGQEAAGNGVQVTPDFLDSLANYMVTDIPRRFTSYRQRQEQLQKSGNAVIRDILPESFPGKTFFEDRMSQIQRTFEEFFLFPMNDDMISSDGKN